MDYFLKIEGIAGESLDSKHKGEIELESFSWGETQAAAPGRAGAGAGKVQIGDLHVGMKFNKASPLLLLACASGQHLKAGVLTARRAGKDALEFLVYKFSDLLVSSYATTATPEQPYPLDQVAFNFGRIQVEYRPQQPDGKPGAAVQVGWDVKANRKV
ncbi:MAG TPA: type VI secretion system tube protein Hcp [Gaiellaceae bacterium]|nr:type VI secretion system tube protein Hcp [Gaiellaceae bacterium]